MATLHIEFEANGSDEYTAEIQRLAAEHGAAEVDELCHAGNCVTLFVAHDIAAIEAELKSAGKATLNYPHASVVLSLYDQSTDIPPGETFSPAEREEYFRGIWCTVDGWCRCQNCIRENTTCESSLGHITLSFAHWRVAQALEEIERQLH